MTDNFNSETDSFSELPDEGAGDRSRDDADGAHASKPVKKPSHFRKALLRGLGFALPPLLTIVLFLWAWNTIETYVLLPVESGLRHIVVWSVADIKDHQQVRTMLSKDVKPNERYKPASNPPEYTTTDGKTLVRIKNKWIPLEVYETVEEHPGEITPTTATAYYHRYARVVYLPRWYVIPIFLLLFVLILYFLGKFLTVGVGRILYNYFERVINGLPIISNVYSSVKQVTDFAFTDNEVHFTRIVAVEYPRKGIWSMGFVTGESMLDIRTAVNEPVVSVLMPTSPMPATGFTITVPKSETIDLNITMDQAIQFCVSCGVVVPPQQLQKMLINGKTTASLEDNSKRDKDSQLQITQQPSP